MPLTNLPLVNQGLQRFVPEMQYRVSLIEPSGTREEPTGYYRPPTHEEITNRVSRITQPGRRDFIVRPQEPGAPAAGRFGVPLGNTTATTIWRTYGDPVTQPEINMVETALNTFNHYAAAVAEPQLHEKAITEGAIKFALKHVTLVAGQIAYTADSGLLVTTRPTSPVYLARDLWNVKVQAIIGTIRYLFDAKNWNALSTIITVDRKNDWWTFLGASLYASVIVGRWAPTKWW